MPDVHTPDHEARLRAAVDRAVKPYLGVAPPVMLAKLRELAERFYRERPEAIRTLQLAGHAHQVRSGPVATSLADHDAPAAAGERKG